MKMHPHYTLLIIEDNYDHQALIKDIITDKIQEAELVFVSAREELMDYMNQCERLEVNYPKVILLDLYLPTKSIGLQTLELIKSRLSFSVIPVIVFSYSINNEDIAECYARGISAYMSKPSTIEEWNTYLTDFKEYWIDTVYLPK